MKVQWHPPGDPRHSASTPVVPASPGLLPGAVTRLDTAGATYWLRVQLGAVLSWKKLAAGDWIITSDDGTIHWWPNRRYLETQSEGAT